MKHLFLVLILAFAFTNLYSQYDPTVCDNGDQTSWGNLKWLKLEPASIPGCPADPDCTIEVEYFKRQRADGRYEYQIKNIKYYNCGNCNMSEADLFKIAYQMFLVWDRYELGFDVPVKCNNQIIFSAAACWEKTETYGTNGRTGLNLKSCNTECCASQYVACLIVNDQNQEVFEVFKSFPISTVTDNCVGDCEFISCDYINPNMIDNPIDVGDIEENLTGGFFGKKSSSFDNNKSLKIIPNPAKDKLRIEYENDLTGEIKLQFYDIRGNLLAKSTLNKSSYKLVETINIEFFTKGLINYKFEIDGQIITGSFIKE